MTVRVAPNFILALPWYFDNSIREKIACAQSPDAEGWIMLGLAFESLEAARDRLLDLGRGVEVLEPYALRRSLVDIAEPIVALYTQKQIV